MSEFVASLFWPTLYILTYLVWSTDGTVGERSTEPSSRRDHPGVYTRRYCYLSTPPVVHANKHKNVHRATTAAVGLPGSLVSEFKVASHNNDSSRIGTVLLYTIIIIKGGVRNVPCRDRGRRRFYPSGGGAVRADRSRSLEVGPLRVVHGSILCDPVQPNPSSDWPNPTQPTTSGKIWTQPDPTQFN